jgi:hypothetical protein
MSMKNLMCKPCWFHWDLYSMSMKTSLSCHIDCNCVGDWKNQQHLDHTELGRSKIVLPQDWFEKPNKTSWNFAVLPTLHLFYQKSPPLSPGSGLPTFMLPATQPRLCTYIIRSTFCYNYKKVIYTLFYILVIWWKLFYVLYKFNRLTATLNKIFRLNQLKC